MLVEGYDVDQKKRYKGCHDDDSGEVMTRVRKKDTQ
jgi:hypothetical protein